METMFMSYRTPITASVLKLTILSAGPNFFLFFLLYDVSKLNLKIEISERIRRTAPTSALSVTG